jgi:alpha-beta hydrolase superfamily lysophospholipase
MAARVAAADTRIRACIVNGASAAPTVPEFRSAREQIFAFTGTSALAAATQTLSELSFDPVEHRIAAPCLVLRGGADPLVSEPQQRQFLDGMPSARSEFLVWPDGEHTLYNHAAERDAITADWFRTHLTTAAHSWPDG